MKKIFLFCFCTIALLFSSCKKKSESQITDFSDFNDWNDWSETFNSNLNSDAKEVDLTILSSTMVYAEVFNMLINPESYNGKTVKMKGDFAAYKPILPDGSTSDREFLACVIADAAACCQQGLEFNLKENDLRNNLSEGDEITVEGIFEIYQENGYTSIRIKDCVLL